MKDMRDGKGPITSSALNKMMKKFEATGSLESRTRRIPVPTTVEQTAQFMLAFSAHGGIQCSRSFMVDKSVI